MTAPAPRGGAPPPSSIDPIGEVLEALDLEEIGPVLHRRCADLFPITRSITGDGVRETLGIIGQDLDLEVHEVPTGTPVFDWTVPPEWNLRDAYIVGPDGRRVVDLEDSNLHVVGYSSPVRKRISLEELRQHLHTLPDRPAWIPYRTSYYADGWGFCAADAQVRDLPEGEYEVVIDASLEDGSLTYGEAFLPGRTEREVLITCHVCHPSLANDNLSGISVVTELGRVLGALDLRYSYRMLFIPGTIGSITWLARNEERVDLIDHGLVITGVGDRGGFTYKRSRRGTADVDRAAALALAADGAEDHDVIDFYPYGYDERQFCSPGFDLPVGRLSRTPHNEYPEYHTSADDLDFITPEALAGSLTMILEILQILEGDQTFRNTNPRCEPQLGKRGLYRAVGGNVDKAAVEMGLLWVLNQSDGTNSLLDIAERSGLPFAAIRRAARALYDHGLLE